MNPTAETDSQRYLATLVQRGYQRELARYIAAILVGADEIILEHLRAEAQ